MGHMDLAIIYSVIVFRARELFSPVSKPASLQVFTCLMATTTTVADKALDWILSHREVSRRGDSVQEPNRE